MTRPLPVTAYAAVSPTGYYSADYTYPSKDDAEYWRDQFMESGTIIPVTIIPTEQYEAMVEAFSNLLAFTKFELKGTANAERQPWKRLVQKSEDALSALKEQDHG